MRLRRCERIGNRLQICTGNNGSNDSLETLSSRRLDCSPCARMPLGVLHLLVELLLQHTAIIFSHERKEMSEEENEACSPMPSALACAGVTL